uniref:Uncharacterized protein n=1 Tax=Glossina austeni TaxID=7395 RepID=A0A1A9UVA0_GLOAU
MKQRASGGSINITSQVEESPTVVTAAAAAAAAAAASNKLRNTKECIPETFQSYLDVCSAAHSSLCRLLLKFFSAKLAKKIDRELQRTALAPKALNCIRFALSSRTNTDTGKGEVMQVSAASTSSACSRHTPLNQRWGQCKCSMRSTPHEHLLSTSRLLNPWSPLINTESCC